MILIVLFLYMISFFCGCLYLASQNKNITLLQTQLSNEAEDTERRLTGRIISLKGSFEIHITTDHTAPDAYVKLLSFCQSSQERKELKVIYAVSSVGNHQLMISKFICKDHEKYAVQYANELASDMTQFGLQVIRLKVEFHNARGTPMTKTEYYRFSEYLKENYNETKPYFEFHVKVMSNSNFLKSNSNVDLDFKTLEHDVSAFTGVAISYNLCSRNLKPLLTIRIYDVGFISAQKYKDRVLDTLKAFGYVFETAIQQEFSILDTEPSLDYGWLSLPNP
jgi:hypothetical protein